MANRTKTTEARARGFAPVDGREAVLWHSAGPRYGQCVRPNGRKMSIVLWCRNGSVVRQMLGALADGLTVEDAPREDADRMAQSLQIMNHHDHPQCHYLPSTSRSSIQGVSPATGPGACLRAGLINRKRGTIASVPLGRPPSGTDAGGRSG